MTSLKQVAKAVLPNQAWSVLKRSRLQFDTWRFHPYEASHVYYDLPLRVWIANSLGQGWYDHDWKAMPEMDLLRGHKLRPGARVFDLGAHQCVVASILSRIVGPDGNVVALEATQFDAEVGRRNCSRNGIKNVEILNAAVAAKSGQITFTLDGHVDNASEKTAKVVVDSFSIDDLSARFGIPDVLFIDVEGYECEALTGASATLRHRPDCFVEVHGSAGLESFGGSLQKVLAFFPRDQYELFAGWPDGSSFDQLHAEDEHEYVGRRFFLIAIAR